MEDARFIINIGIALLAALVGGLLARSVRLPMIIGYLVAGVVVGPYTPGLHARPETIDAVANLGVALLMFTVGVNFSIDELRSVRKTAILGALIVLAGMIVAGIALGLAFHWGVYGGVFLGCALSLSSTAVMMRLLGERGETGSSHGAVMLGILVVQDFSLVLMAALLPALAEISTHGIHALASVGIALLKAALFIGVVLLLAWRGVPGLMDRIARFGSAELFLLTGVSLCLIAAVAAARAGLGIALGAFIAGIVISETDYNYTLFSQVRPLRDIFATLFFVSIGMLLNPKFLVAHWLPILAVVLMIVIVKSLVSVLAIYALGHHGKTAIVAGLGLAQIGEFSFVLANIGSSGKLISPEISGVILSGALITLLIIPFLFGAAGPLYARLNRVPRISRWLNRNPDHSGEGSAGESCPDARALVVGYGRVGRYVSNALSTERVRHFVVDYDGKAVARARSDSRASGTLIQGLYGDAASSVVLEQAAPSCLELAVVALPEASMTEATVKALRRLAPEIKIVARVHRGVDISRLRAAGADDVIHAEFEAGAEMIRQSLRLLGVAGEEIDRYTGETRNALYREA